MLTDLLLKIGAFLVVIGLIVTVHEFGHFWVARRLGVKVLRFSLGFGRPLLTWQRPNDATEYVVALWPLGGYVKMVDEREGEVAPDDLPHAFNRQPVWKRAAIVVAGPLANFLFALLLYWLVLMAGESGIRPEVGLVEPDSLAAAAQFEVGDLIVAVDERDTPTWSAVWLALLDQALNGKDAKIKVRTAAGHEHQRILLGSDLARLDPGRGFLDALGLTSARLVLPPILGELVTGDPAMQAGLLPGDRVSAIDGEPISHWHQIVEIVRDHPGQRLQFQIERGASTQQLAITPQIIDQEGEQIGRIGASPQVPDDLLTSQQVIVRLAPLPALSAAVGRVVNVSTLTLRLIGRMITGQASIHNLSSPIGIADAAGKTATIGLEPFVQLLALISVSLGLLNLLPIPLLDGGHLLFFAIEAVRRQPVSERVQEIGQHIGLVVLVGLMSLAFYVDLARLLG